MKKILIFTGLIFFGLIGFAQQEPQFNQNIHNKLTVNPGYAGMNDLICAKILYRNQWVGFPGQPVTMLFNGDLPVRALHGGFGLTIMSDGLGQEDNIDFRISYSYHLEFPSGKLGLGLRAGFINKAMTSDWKTTDVPPEQDESIPMGNPSAMGFNIGFGAYYRTDQLYVGLSSSQLAQPSLNNLADNKVYQLKRHYYLMAGYTFPISADFDIIPSTFIKTETASTQIDINCLVEYKKRFWGGITFRPGDALSPIIGLEIIPDLNFGYSYEITLSKLNNYSSGSHEIFLGYCFKITKEYAPSIHRNVRFL